MAERKAERERERERQNEEDGERWWAGGRVQRETGGGHRVRDRARGTERG